MTDPTTALGLCSDGNNCMQVAHHPDGSVTLWSSRRPDQRITLDPDEVPGWLRPVDGDLVKMGILKRLEHAAAAPPAGHSGPQSDERAEVVPQATPSEPVAAQEAPPVVPAPEAQGGPETARRRMAVMAARARERKATAPDYPDTPEQIADQAATTEALSAGQAEAMWTAEGAVGEQRGHVVLDELLRGRPMTQLDDINTEPLWWLSFCDPDIAASIPERERKPGGPSFLGVIIVQAPDLPAAITRSHLLGINPGGEIAVAGPLPERSVAAEWRDRLLTAAEAAASWGGQIADAIPDQRPGYRDEWRPAP